MIFCLSAYGGALTSPLQMQIVHPPFAKSVLKIGSIIFQGILSNPFPTLDTLKFFKPIVSTASREVDTANSTFLANCLAS